MARYADIDVLLEDLNTSDEGNFRTAITQWLEMHQVEDVVPVIHAHWKWDEDGVDWNIGAWVCSNCGLMFPDFDIATNKNRRVELWAHSKYCGHCGAKMDEE